MNSNPDPVLNSVPCNAGETTAVAKLPEFNRRQRDEGQDFRPEWIRALRLVRQNDRTDAA